MGIRVYQCRMRRLTVCFFGPNSYRNKVVLAIFALMVCVYIYQIIHGLPRVPDRCVLDPHRNYSNAVFKQIRGNLTSILVYSAYRDQRASDIVRIIAVGQIKPRPILFCHWVANDGKLFGRATDADTSQILNHDIQYASFYIECPYPKEYYPLQVGVSASRARAGKMQILRINQIPTSTPKNASLAACVCPLHGDKIDERNLIAWIEMNRLLGVQRFIFYNFSAAPRLQPLFNYYTDKNVVELLSWDTQPIPTNRIGVWPPANNLLPYYGQFGSNNECLHRMTNRYRFVMFSDLDELIVPAAYKRTLPELLLPADNNKTHAFVFRASYVRPDFAEEKDWDRVTFIRHSMREARVLAKDVGPKLIVKPNLVTKIGVHDVISKLSGGLRVFDPNEALLLHYRSPPGYLILQSDKGIRDDRVFVFKRQLLANIAETEKALTNRKPRMLFF